MHLRELEMDAEEADGRQRAWETTQSAMCLQGKRENLGSKPVTHLCKKLGMGYVPGVAGPEWQRQEDPWSSLFRSLANIIELQNQRETLPQKVRWRVIEEDT